MRFLILSPYLCFPAIWHSFCPNCRSKNHCNTEPLLHYLIGKTLPGTVSICSPHDNFIRPFRVNSLRQSHLQICIRANECSVIWLDIEPWALAPFLLWPISGYPFSPQNPWPFNHVARNKLQCKQCSMMMVICDYGHSSFQESFLTHKAGHTHKKTSGYPYLGPN